MHIHMLHTSIKEI